MKTYRKLKHLNYLPVNQLLTPPFPLIMDTLY